MDRPTAAPPTEPALAVTLRVNGAAHRLALDPRATLLDVLRERLGLTAGSSPRSRQGAARPHRVSRSVLMRP